MSIPSTSFSLQVQSSQELEEWILVLVRVLREKADGWQLTIVQTKSGELSFECKPAMTNEEVARGYIRLLTP